MTQTFRLASERLKDSRPTFYFFLLPVREPDATRYEHPAIALGEGFAALDIPFFANIDHWHSQSGGAPLFRNDPTIDAHACSAVFFTSDWLAENRPMPAHLFEGPTRPITVYLDHEDGSRIHSLRPDFPKFDVVLRAHFGAAGANPRNFHPWAFGLSNRIIEATAPRQPPEARVKRLLVSYRHSAYPHAIRKYMDRVFLSRLDGRLPADHYDTDLDLAPRDPQTEHLWRMTGRRHSSHYYATLRESLACACFGGHFVPRWPRRENHPLSRVAKRLAGRFLFPTRRIVQFDSWRFWESLSAGCATVHLDLKKYGALLPEMPQNWVHYVGLDLDNLAADIERISRDPELLEQIGVAGRKWSIAAYGPRATAERFLALIGLPARESAER